MLMHLALLLTVQQFDVVIAGGRVIDPETRLDAVRWVGVRGGKIAAISPTALSGTITLDARGLVVAPGFIDMHAHGHNDESYRLYAMNGVTTALELEVGTADVPAWYTAREGKSLLNYGISASHLQSRARVFNDPGQFLPTGPGANDVATPDQIAAIVERIKAGLKAGGLGVGMGLQYTPGATTWEVLEAFRAAAAAKAPVFVHTRSWGTTDPGSSVESFMEVIGAASLTGAPLHIVHLNSMSLSQTPLTLRLVEEARARGLDVTTEAYPYSAGMTRIESALFERFENVPDSMYQKIMWVETGERLTRETFQKYRKQGGGAILFLNTPEMEALAINSPLTAIASDGGVEGGKGHPRTSGSYARVLGHYVREAKTLSLDLAIRKMSLMPAQRLEKIAPQFRNKGRIKLGADADIAVFDPATVIDKSTYQAPAAPAFGFKFVLVNGVPVVRDGSVVDGVLPGRAARAPVR